MTNSNDEKKPRRGGARLAKPEGKSSGEKKPPMSGTDKKKRMLMILGIIAAVILCAVLAYRQWAKAPELPSHQDSPIDDPISTEAPEELEGVKPYLTGERKKDFYTFLIIGRDTAGGGNTDTLMLAAYNVADQQVALMSIPRDTMVNVGWDVKKINSVYNVYSHKGEEASIQALEEVVAGLIGFQTDYTVIMEWDAVGEIVDAIGGVWFEVPFNMYYRDPYQDLFINQPKGYRQLSGSDAMEVVRWRKNNSGVSTGDPSTDGSDLARTKVQQDFIAAVLRQCLQIQNVTKINQIAAAFTNNVKTELTIGNLVWFAEQALTGGFSTENMYACTMPNTPKDVYSRSYNVYLSYVVPNGTALLELVNQHFNPYTQDVTLSNLDLMRVNEDGSLSSTSGVVRDKKATLPVSEQMPADEPVETEPVDEGDLPPLETEPLPGDDPNEEPTGDLPPEETGELPPQETEDLPPEETPAQEPPAELPSEQVPQEQPPEETAPAPENKEEVTEPHLGAEE